MQDLGLRKASALWFLLLYVLVGVPVWYQFTSIQRAHLPAQYIEQLRNNKSGDLHMVIPVYLRSPSHKFPDLHDAVQAQVNHVLKKQDKKVEWSLQVLPYEESVDLNKEYTVSLLPDSTSGFILPFGSRETLVYYDKDTIRQNDLPFFIAQTLVEHTFEHEWRRLDRGYQPAELQEGVRNMAVDYSPQMHLSVSLLTGDGHPVSWDIADVSQKYLTPLRELLSPLVNFTVDTAVTYFNSLNLDKLKGAQSLSANELAHTVDLSDLSSANYYQEPSALHLAILFPSADTGPLLFINSSRHWQSFLVPQWGTLIINDRPLPENAHLGEDYLAPIMHRFSRELFTLLGITETPDSKHSPQLVLDSAQRLTILENLNKSVETLWSLVKMTDNLPQMSIPQDVLDNVKHALALRLEVVELLNDPHKVNSSDIWAEALVKSNRLAALCEKAFFHKEMVQQNFLPQEHKVAVYLPLLGPLTIVTFAGCFKVLTEHTKRTTERKEKEGPLEAPEAPAAPELDTVEQ
ncbi:AaceriADR180Cp [[Ashbya] aceris (nom. inval.)]|nr:AaceriADR180Cp [[Ashbya] aceris (nom. inval.)]